MHLIQIPPDTLDRLWPLAAKLLEKSIAMSNGFTTLENERDAITEQRKQLWFVINPEGEVKNEAVAAGITWIETNADGSKTAHIGYFGGKDMHSWFDLKHVFENWARDEGCRNIKLWARKGWAKHLPDFKITHYIMAKELIVNV